MPKSWGGGGAAVNPRQPIMLPINNKVPTEAKGLGSVLRGTRIVIHARCCTLRSKPKIRQVWHAKVNILNEIRLLNGPTVPAPSFSQISCMLQPFAFMAGDKLRCIALIEFGSQPCP